MHMVRRRRLSGVDEMTFPVSISMADQIRHRHRAALRRVRALEGDRAEFEFHEPQTAVTPGQAVVFYDGDAVHFSTFQFFSLPSISACLAGDSSPAR